MKTPIYITILFCLMASLNIFAQRKSRTTAPTNSLMVDSTFSGLKLRNIGPGFMSGRIADIAVHPENNSIWYVAVGSGGVWKTINSGLPGGRIQVLHGAKTCGLIQELS